MNTRAIVVILAASVGAHAAAQPKAFDSVTVTRNTSGESRGGLRLMPDGGLKAVNVTLRQLLNAAYQRHAFDRRQFEGGPPWIETDRFDVVAQAAGGHEFGLDSFPLQTWLMLRSALEDQFKLRVRRADRVLPVYELTMASPGGGPGPRLRKADVDCAAEMRKKVKEEQPDRLQAGRPVCAVATYAGRLSADSVSMPALASLLSGIVDRVVVDRTGLAGGFAVELEAVEIKPAGSVGPSNRPSETTQSIFAAMPEQLGLRLVPATGSVEVLVVEHAEHPATKGGRP